METWVICCVAHTVLGFEVFTGFVDGKPKFGNFSVVSFADNKKYIQVMIFLSETLANEKLTYIKGYHNKRNETLFISPLSTVIAAGRAWK